jgi:alkanesulfonate monooxygenase SsuD/methylene tetrahydromethanopterin reductase-like flavin-dependent oxidoreductase (luciferase family)
VLSSADPVRAYQNFATLDLVSNGRAELMAGRGSFTESFPLFGYSLGDYDALFAEKLDLLLALRAEGPTTWAGQFRPSLDGLVVHPRPEQPLPVWLAVGGTPESVVRAGTLGLPMALAIIGGTWAGFAPHADLYRRALAYGEQDEATPLAVHSHGYVALDEAAARREFLPGYRATFAAIGRERGWPPMSDAAVEALRAATGVFFTGGDQLRITTAIGGTRVDSALQTLVHERGVILAGTSAGAAMMSGTMIVGGDGAGVRMSSVRTGPGLEFLPGVLIDMHFAERGRLNRLLSAVGLGLHLVTYYDRVFTAEYTLNGLGQTGYFFRAEFPI